MKTKTFDSFFGTKEVSRKEFIEQWLKTTHQYTQMFYGADKGGTLMDFQFVLQELAGKAWDKHESWADKAEAELHENPLCK